MNWLDVVVLIVVAWSVIASLRKGLTREIVGLVTAIIALLLGIWFYGTAASFFDDYVKSRALANFAGFAVVFGAVMLIGAGASFLAGKFLKVTGLSFVDHALGALFGVVRGVLIAIALIMALIAFAPENRPPAAVVNSRTAPYVSSAARVISLIAPHELKEGFRKTYDHVQAAWAEALDRRFDRAPHAKKEKDEREL